MFRDYLLDCLAQRMAIHISQCKLNTLKVYTRFREATARAIRAHDNGDIVIDFGNYIKIGARQNRGARFYQFSKTITRKQ